jgi:hypothetical protein
MPVTPWLVSFVVLLGLAGAWRLYRWRWRPRLELDFSTPGRLNVRNAGSTAAKHCRATLLRLDRFENGAWRRLEPGRETCPMSWSDGSTRRDLRRGADDEILLVAEDAALAAGRYRFEVAVIDGEEKRARFELELEDGRWKP